MLCVRPSPLHFLSISLSFVRNQAAFKTMACAKWRRSAASCRPRGSKARSMPRNPTRISSAKPRGVSGLTPAPARACWSPLFSRLPVVRGRPWRGTDEVPWEHISAASPGCRPLCNLWLGRSFFTWQCSLACGFLYALTGTQHVGMVKTHKTFSEQRQAIVNRHIEAGQECPASKRQIAAWAIVNKLWEPQRSTLIDQCAEELARSMREEYITDAQGRSVRAKHAARTKRDGEQLVLPRCLGVVRTRYLGSTFQPLHQAVDPFVTYGLEGAFLRGSAALHVAFFMP